MRCDTCKRDTDLVLRVIVDKDYNRSLARPIFNCADCFQKKEQEKPYRMSSQPGGGQSAS